MISYTKKVRGNRSLLFLSILILAITFMGCGSRGGGDDDDSAGDSTSDNVALSDLVGTCSFPVTEFDVWMKTSTASTRSVDSNQQIKIDNEDLVVVPGSALGMIYDYLP